MNSEKHFKDIEEEVKKYYLVAEQARSKGIDPEIKIEVPIATSLAEKAIGLVSVIYPQLNDKKVVNRILELEAQYGQLDTAVSFKIAEEVAKERFCKFANFMEAMDAGIRVGFAYITLGVVSSPLEGFTNISIGKTRGGQDYLKAYFSRFF